MDLTKEGQAIKGLLDKADKLEAEADRKTAQADDYRWQAAERATNLHMHERVSQKAIADAMGVGYQSVSLMVKTWLWWQEVQSRSTCEGRPIYWDALEMARDAALAERAAKQGKRPTTLAITERNARQALRNEESAAAVIKDKKTREATKRAIRQVEEEEDRAEVEAIRQKALADKAAAGRPDLDAPLPSSGFGANAQMEAGVLLGTAGKSLAAFIKLVRARGPVPEVAREALLEELDELAGRVQWAREALLNKITNWDEALAQLTGE